MVIPDRASFNAQLELDVTQLVDTKVQRDFLFHVDQAPSALELVEDQCSALGSTILKIERADLSSARSEEHVVEAFGVDFLGLFCGRTHEWWGDSLGTSGRLEGHELIEFFDKYGGPCLKVFAPCE